MENIKKENILMGFGKKVLTGMAFYVSDDFIDIAKGELGFGGMKISYLQRFPLLKSIKHLTFTEAKEDLDRILDKAVDLEKDKPYRIAVNLKNDYFVLRRFSMRDIPDKELDKAVLFEAQKYVPYPIEELTFDYIKCDKKSGYCEVLFAASEKKNVHDVTGYFTEKGINPTIIEDTTTLIEKILTANQKLDMSKAYLSVHYEPNNKVILTGIVKKKPFFFREINIMPVEDEFRTSELSYSPLKDVWPLIGGDVISAVEYMKKEANKPVEKILISGFQMYEDEDKAAGDLSIPAERVNIKVTAGINIDNKDRYLPVISLLGEMFRTPNLNMSPSLVAQKDYWIFKPAVIAGVASLCVILFTHIFLAGMVVKERKQVERLKKNFDVQKIITADSTREEVAARKKTMEEKINFIHKIISKNVSLTEKLGEMGKDIPSSAWINSITYLNPLADKTTGSLQIEGVIYYKGDKGVSEVNEILEAFKKDEKVMKGFGKASLVSVTKKKLLDKDIMEYEILLK